MNNFYKVKKYLIYKKKYKELLIKLAQLENLNKELIKKIEDSKNIQERLQHMVYHDALTGVYNRSYLDNFEFKEKVKKAKSLGIIFCDIDLLKLINDTFGHLIGDNLIFLTSQILKNSIRDKDIIVRMGGDEFVIVSFDISEEETKEMCDFILKKVEAYSVENNNLPIFTSLGFSYGEGEDFCLEEILRKADDNMYKFKLSKRKLVKKKITENIINYYKIYENELYEHGKRVASYALKLGELFGFSRSSIERLKIACIYHDIGKINFNNNLCNGKNHSEVGYRIAKISDLLNFCAEWILQHHENWDGTGCPLSLEGDNIILEAQIIGVSDYYDRMRYYNGLNKIDALEAVRSQADIKFSKDLVNRFTTIFQTTE
ncbi:putative diguanylate cyclase YdaM [Clostridium homopropionicum DSM 5847]|uniref:Putative diguanylate cyclase YdaM n=1 Tax=Clostridium homopropionicum DSM 5847 TaxID=1121318 RepID=A0A0L6ZFC7_9CLOT|nr:diguanylate cyclase [Clostridium homopropionicum]KOA21493.1 putative diguanylate cyclase YdaM [Clostridium homopropionicum DSM 5847]SFG07917.1 diguanylate cyclase (GGDEF) domain-containing protein/HDIG domain-containing protein [Clostridium homopropionicum]